jgi:hypothetical protein
MVAHTVALGNCARNICIFIVRPCELVHTSNVFEKYKFYLYKFVIRARRGLCLWEINFGWESRARSEFQKFGAKLQIEKKNVIDSTLPGC